MLVFEEETPAWAFLIIEELGPGWRAIGHGGTTEEYREGSEAWRSWRRGLIAAEREVVVASRGRGELSPEAMRRVERDLDLQESRLGADGAARGLRSGPLKRCADPRFT